MNFKTNFLGMILLLASSSTFSSQSLAQKNVLARCLGYLASTKVIYLFDKYIQNAVQQQMHKIIPYGNELASSEHQALGKEAQDAVGVPAEYQVPIKNLSPQSPMIEYIGALAETDGIYINEQKFNQASIGSKRVTLFHEAIHKKYNDLSVKEILESLAILCSTTCTYGLLKKIDTIYSNPLFVRWGIILSVGCIASIFTHFKFQKFMERRADIEGCYASSCFVCVREVALKRKKFFEEEYTPLKNNGYLFYEELEKIAQELEQESKVCDHHKSN